MKAYTNSDLLKAIFMMIDTEAPDGFYDTGLFNEFVPKGDTVKVYSFNATKRLFGIK